MKSSGNIKIEKKPLWFSDIILTAQSISDNARDGWYLSDIELIEGQFTYKKGVSGNYYYWFQTSQSNENLCIYTDKDFEKVFDKNSVTLWRRKEVDPACLENIRISFRDSTSEREEKWLNEQAKKGFFLLRTNRPEYTFELTESMDLTYRIVYDENIVDYKKFLEPYIKSGWEYVWGNNGYHYFVSEIKNNADDSVFNRIETNCALLKRKKTVFNTFLIFSISLLLFSIVITCVNIHRYMGLDPISELQRMDAISRDITYNFGAIILSLLFTTISAFLTQKVSKQIKNLK